MGVEHKGRQGFVSKCRKSLEICCRWCHSPIIAEMLMKLDSLSIKKKRKQIMTYIHDLFTTKCIEWEKISHVPLMGSSAPRNLYTTTLVWIESKVSEEHYSCFVVLQKTPFGAWIFFTFTFKATWLLDWASNLIKSLNRPFKLWFVLYMTV